MSDAVRLEESIAMSLLSLLPQLHPDNWLTLVKLVTSIILSKEVQLSKIADEVVYEYKESSLTDRFRRFMVTENVITFGIYSLFVQMALDCPDYSDPVVLSIDSSKVGGGCLTLMVSLGYSSRALPLFWLTFKGQKGHTSQHKQLELLELIESLLPDGVAVSLLGDGEFDGVQVIEWLKARSTWSYTCRTAQSTLALYDGNWLALNELPLQPNQKEAFFTGLTFTNAHKVKSVNLLVVWVSKEQEYRFFVTNFETAKEARYWYRRRFKIETLFSDIKNRGFKLHKSRLNKSERVNRLLIVVTIAYIFVVFWGVLSIISAEFTKIVRTDRFEHSLFSLGLKFIKRLLKKSKNIPFLLPCHPYFLLSSRYCKLRGATVVRIWKSQNQRGIHEKTRRGTKFYRLFVD